MTFTSTAFVIFLPLALILFWTAASKGNMLLRNFAIITTGWFFYAWCDWRFLFLLVGTIIFNFYMALAIGSNTGRNAARIWLACGIVLNTGVLLFFKYFNFFTDGFAYVFSQFGFRVPSPAFSILLPAGISFFTFQAMGYLIDVYREKTEAEKSPWVFGAFMSFFPVLLAGPIERSNGLLKQLKTCKPFSYPDFSEGFKLIVAGLLLKLVLADRAAIYVDAVYNNVGQHDGLTFAAATFMFAFQIYGDFAGYSLMAIGIGRLLGFQLINNFNRPYFAFSVTDFWRRWHISLSGWLRDYIFTPLAVKWRSAGKAGTVAAIVITFVICGLWHGDRLTFLVWGLLNGLLLGAEAVLNPNGRKSVARIVPTFILIGFTWIFFRSHNLSDALIVIGDIFTKPGKLFIPGDADVISPILATVAIFGVIAIEVKQEFFNRAFSFRNHPLMWVRMAYFGFLIFLILYFGVFGAGQFIYFQF